MNTNKKKDQSAIEHESKQQYPFSRKNFIAMIVAGAMIVIGFLLMLGSPSTPEQFNPDIFSTRRIVVGPFITFLGFVAMAIAIVMNPSESKARQTGTTTQNAD